jgi:hypothetical protein
MSSIPGQKKPSKVFVIGPEKERAPLLGYYDIAPWYKDYRKTFNNDQDEFFNPNRYEKQAQALIDIPKILTRDIGTRTDYNEKNPAYRFKDPYSDTYKNRVLNAWYFDPVIQESIYIRTSNILGKGMRTILEPDQNVATIFDEKLGEAVNLDSLLKPNEKKGLMEYIRFVEKITKIQSHYPFFIRDKFIGGRAAVHKRTNPKIIKKYKPKFMKNSGWTLHDDTPTNLMDLEWWRLGQVRVDRWDDVDRVEYRDSSRFPPPEDPREEEKGLGYMIPIEQLIYSTRIEKRYGRSIIQPILSVSEQNRQMNEQDLLEITKSRWAPSGLFVSETMSQEEGVDFIEERKAASDSFVKGKMEYIKLTTDADPEPLTKLRRENIRYILMMTDVPSFMMKLEEITNRAMGNAVLGAWRALTLENDRTEFRDMMWDQFYAPLVTLWFQANGQPDFDIVDLDIRVAFVFQNLGYEDDETQAKVVDLLQKNGVETLTESRIRMNLPPKMAEDELKVELEEAKEEGKQEGKTEAKLEVNPSTAEEEKPELNGEEEDTNA